MSEKGRDTTIAIRKETRNKLRALKVHPRQSYTEVIEELIIYADKYIQSKLKKEKK